MGSKSITVGVDFELIALSIRFSLKTTFKPDYHCQRQALYVGDYQLLLTWLKWFGHQRYVVSTEHTAYVNWIFCTNGLMGLRDRIFR